MVGRSVLSFACVVCCLAQAQAATVGEAMREARSLLNHAGSAANPDVDRFIATALDVAGGCPATIAAELPNEARKERQRTIDALIACVAESGSRRGAATLLQLASCGVESPLWDRTAILERAMAHMIAAVPCLPPLSGEVAAEAERLADFPILRLRKGVLRAELPTRDELSDLAYFMVAVTDAGEEVGARAEGASWPSKAPSSPARAELVQQLAVAKSAGNVAEIERAARGYLETLGFPDPLHGSQEDVVFWHVPRYHHIMRDLAESWEALGRFHEAAGLWRRNTRAGAPCGTGASHVWQEQVKAVIRDEEIDGRCDVAVAERLLDVGGSQWVRDDPYGPKRLADARFDVARLLRGALLTGNRDAGERLLSKAIASLSATTRLFATMRLRDRGPEDWERRLHAARGVADTMQAAAIPLLLRAAEQSLPPGRQRALSALGDLVERPLHDPCGTVLGGFLLGSSEWTRPVRPIGHDCDDRLTGAARGRLARAIMVYANDQNAGTREATAVALGKIGIPAARPVLRRLLQDHQRNGSVCAETVNGRPAKCRPHYPIREAARAALDNIVEIERNWRDQRTHR